MTERKIGNNPKKGQIIQDLAAAFYHEGFARAVPGLVVLALYVEHQVRDAFAQLHDGSIVLALGILVVAWLIGLAIEFAGFVPIALGLRFLKRRTRWNWPRGVHARLLPDSLPGSEKVEWIYYRKYIGEKLMIRGMFLISLFTLIKTPRLFGGFQWELGYGILASILFFLFWFWFFSNPVQPKSPNDPMGSGESA